LKALVIYSGGGSRGPVIYVIPKRRDYLLKIATPRREAWRARGTVGGCETGISMGENVDGGICLAVEIEVKTQVQGVMTAV